MPERNNFSNPYRFVKTASLDQESIQALEQRFTHERFQGLSGSIEAEILTLTPLVIGGKKNPRDEENEEKSFVHNPENDHPLIPGASLKGVILTIYQILCGSNEACKSIFGDMQRGNSGKNLKGHIYFSDAVLDTQRSPQEAHNVQKLPPITTVLASPKDRHSAFYCYPEDVKLYHHQPKTKSAFDLTRQGSSTTVTQATAIPPDCRFTFTVHFENLNKDQLSFFLRSLFLDNGLCHKIGGAKPLGAGTVSIRPLKITLCPDKAQYYRGQNNVHTFIGNDDCFQEISRQSNIINIPDDVRKMLLWRPIDNNQYRYPDYTWFRQNSQIPLKTVDNVYPNPVQQEIAVAQQDILQRWQRNQESGAKVVKEMQQKAEDEAKRAAYESLSPIQKALQIWEKRSYDLQYLYDPKLFDKEIKELPHEECQKQMLRLLCERQQQKCKDWKKTCEKAQRQGKKGKEGPWLKLLELAKRLEVSGLERISG